MIEKLTDEQIERRLTMLEGVITRAYAKDLPSLNQTFQLLLDELVRRDMRKQKKPRAKTNERH